MDSNNELEVLEELIADPGWGRFVAHVEREWGSVQYRQRMRHALQNEDQREAFAVDRAAEEIERLVQWPSERVRVLEARRAVQRTVTSHGG